jgi:hypothetical protein
VGGVVIITGVVEEVVVGAGVVEVVVDTGVVEVVVGISVVEIVVGAGNTHGPPVGPTYQSLHTQLSHFHPGRAHPVCQLFTEFLVNHTRGDRDIVLEL